MFMFFLSGNINNLKLGPVVVNSVPYANSSQAEVTEEAHAVLIYANVTSSEFLESPLTTGDRLDWSKHRLYFFDIFNINQEWTPPYTVTLFIHLLSAYLQEYHLPHGDIALVEDAEKAVILGLDYSRGMKNISYSVPEMHGGLLSVGYDSNCPFHCRNDSIRLFRKGENIGQTIVYTWAGFYIDDAITFISASPVGWI